MMQAVLYCGNETEIVDVGFCDSEKTMNERLHEWMDYYELDDGVCDFGFYYLEPEEDWAREYDVM